MWSNSESRGRVIAETLGSIGNSLSVFLEYVNVLIFVGSGLGRRTVDYTHSTKMFTVEVYKMHR